MPSCPALQVLLDEPDELVRRRLEPDPRRGHRLHHARRLLCDILLPQDFVLLLSQML